MVGRESLELSIFVRIEASEPIFRDRLTGRTPDSESGNDSGSNPSPGAPHSAVTRRGHWWPGDQLVAAEYVPVA